MTTENKAVSVKIFSVIFAKGLRSKITESIMPRGERVSNSMPKSHILDKTDFARTFSVFLMMFLFIAIICSLAAMIFSYTRCMTIALNNRYVFGDLKRLGASPAFLLKEIKGQASPVFKIPVTVGMTAMYFLYMLLLIGNDGRLTRGKIGGMAVCFCILTALAAVYYLVYRYTVKSMWGQCGC